MDIGLQVALGIGVAKDYTQGGTVSREQAIADREAEIQAFEARMQQRRRITNPASADRGTPMSRVPFAGPPACSRSTHEFGSLDGSHALPIPSRSEPPRCLERVGKKDTMSKKKTNVLSDTAELLQAFQTRLDALTVRTNAVGRDQQVNRAAIDSILERERINTVKWVDTNRLTQNLIEDFATQKDHNKKVTESLYALRDSTAKAFDCVSQDIERLGRGESQIASLASSVALQSNRLMELVDKAEKAEKRSKPVFYMGFNAFIANNYGGIRLEDKDGKTETTFSVPGDIESLEAQPYGVLIRMKDGAIYILCGGPTPATMFINQFSMAPKPSPEFEEDED